MRVRIAWVVTLVVAVGCTGDIGQTGGPRPGDPGGSGGPPAVDPLLAIESGARRLTQAELDNTLRDLVGEDTAPAARLLNEDEFRPFDNDYTIQQASEALITSLEVLADEVAERAVADPARLAALVPCTPANESEEHRWEEEHDWAHIELWEWPMRPVAETEASCLKCHIDDTWMPDAPTLEYGLGLVENLGK